MAITVIRYSERPELWADTDAVSQAVWPEYNHHGEVLGRYWGRLFEEFPDFQLVLYDEKDGVLAEGHTVPCVWDGTTDGLGDGIDPMIAGAFAAREERRRPTALGVLAAEIKPEFQGRRLAVRVLDGMADVARDAGFSHLIAPVRPSFKDRYPITPIERYVTWTRENGEPFDPWVRVHLRRGAQIAKPIPHSMRITGTVAEWEEWTGMRFPDDGLYTFPAGLAPVEIDHGRDLGTYWEPNVWIVHPVGSGQMSSGTAASRTGLVDTESSASADAAAAFANARARSARLEADLRNHPAEHRVLTGDRPTGPLHIGHYFGSLENRVRLQNLGVELLVLVADYQTLIDRDSPASLPADVEALLADYLAVGIDPSRAVIFAHSQVEALNQLVLPFLSLVTVAELGRNPTVKDETAAAGLPMMSGLMFTYPVHQAADILFCNATVVPVGKDQLPHLELTRLIARRFNRRYSPTEPFFAEPEALLSDAPLLLGIDGQKMSKSRGNAIALSATADETARLIRAAKTDADRHIGYDPIGRPGVSNLVLLAALCLDKEPEQVAEEIGDAGSAALKRLVTDAVNERFAHIRARRSEFIQQPEHLRDILRAGNERANTLAEQTLTTVRQLMHTVY